MRAVIERAMKDLGIVEDANRPNRSARIDEYCRAVHIPEHLITTGKGYWCAAAVSAWLRECSLPVPGKVGSGSCDTWMRWAMETKRWTKTPSAGALVIYGVPGDARHIGLVIRNDHALLSVEANTTVEGAFERDGTAVALKRITKQDPLLGYCSLFPL